ncbi:MAG: class I SAM-dependent methyltransferase [Acidimicrobiales bacterium]|jgi:SAM-dependent methyltransferase
MHSSPTFEELVAEGASVPVEGWDFSWFEGRATEERPSWGYSSLLAGRIADADAALDLQTGGGEVLAGVPHLPRLVAATESWPPNLVVAAKHLHPRGAWVVAAADGGDLPFAAASFDLVVSRHPTMTRWEEVARVLIPGGTYLAQHVGAGTVRELTDFMMGPQPVNEAHTTERAVAGAEAAGLVVVDLRHESLRDVFYDIAAVVHFLRKVIWIVPGFTVDRYRDRLADLHGCMLSEGPFVAHAQRFLIEARKPPAVSPPSGSARPDHRG